MHSSAQRPALAPHCPQDKMSVPEPGIQAPSSPTSSFLSSLTLLWPHHPPGVFPCDTPPGVSAILFSEDPVLHIHHGPGHLHSLNSPLSAKCPFCLLIGLFIACPVPHPHYYVHSIKSEDLPAQALWQLGKLKRHAQERLVIK